MNDDRDGRLVDLLGSVPCLSCFLFITPVLCAANPDLEVSLIKRRWFSRLQRVLMVNTDVDQVLLVVHWVVFLLHIPSLLLPFLA